MRLSGSVGPTSQGGRKTSKGPGLAPGAFALEIEEKKRGSYLCKREENQALFSLFPFRTFILSGENEPVLTGKRTVLEESMNILESLGCCVFPGNCRTSVGTGSL